LETIERIDANDSVKLGVRRIWFNIEKGVSVQYFGQKQRAESIRLMCDSIYIAKRQAR